MKLRFVSIEGFKGISNRVELELSPTLTVIFGPIYHGKSSIIEAIQWCLYCNSFYYVDEKDRWRKIREIFKDIKIINERKPKATVLIEYEHNGQMFRMFAETKTDEGYGFKVDDNGSFKEFTLGELELTPFIRVVTTSQTRRFESEEDLRALDIVFNVTFWRELSDSAKRIADEIFDREKKISEKIYNWRNELGRIYVETLEKYEEAKVRAGDVKLDNIRKNLAELLSYSVDEIPSNLDDLVEFMRKIKNPYNDKIDEKYNEKSRIEEDLRVLENKIRDKDEKIRKFEKVLPEVENRLQELGGYLSKEDLKAEKDRLDKKINGLRSLIGKIDEEKMKFESERFEKERQLKELESSYNRILRLKNEISVKKKELQAYSNDLDKEWGDLKDKLDVLRTNKVKLENELGEKSEIAKIIEQALPLMKEDICIVCGEKEGKTRAEQKLRILREDNKRIFEDLGRIDDEIKKLEEEMQNIEAKIRERSRLQSEIQVLEQEIQAELKKCGVDNFEMLEEKINSLTTEVNDLVSRLSKLKEDIEVKEREKREAENRLSEVNNLIVKIDNIESEVRSKLAEVGVSTWGLTIDEIKQIINELVEKREGLKKDKDHIASKIESLKKKLKEIESEIEQLMIQKETFEDKRKKIREVISNLKEFEDIKQQMKEIELIISGALEELNDLENVLSKYEDRRNFFLKLHHSVNVFIDELIREKLEELNKLIDDFFKTLYDHPEFKTIRIRFDPSKRVRYRIEVIDTSGKIHDERIFSTSGKDMVRLAIGSACSFYGLEKGEFNLLVIDEIQQHLDTKHKVKLARDFIPKICEKSQVILATADKEFWSTIRQYAPEDAIFYEITDWSLNSGPSIRRI